MAKVELVMPKLGESIMEATILGWKKNVGDRVEQDETILEIATDKVDSEVPSPVSGVIAEILFKENDVVKIGAVIAYIMTETEATAPPAPSVSLPPVSAPKAESNGKHHAPETIVAQSTPSVNSAEIVKNKPLAAQSASERFYSPLVRTIAKQEGISMGELEALEGSGNSGRVTKADILGFVENKKVARPPLREDTVFALPKTDATPHIPLSSSNVEIIEMDNSTTIHNVVIYLLLRFCFSNS